ncbi:MAG: hypothetical protein RR954_07525 [Christensenellaceae bacterium]
MHLTQVQIEQFYKLWYSLVWSVNEKHRVIPHFPKPVYGTKIPVSQREFMMIRDKMWGNPKWIKQYINEKGKNDFTEQECRTILDWSENHISGKFVIMRHHKNYSVFMHIPENGAVKLYGVKGISDSFKDICQEQTNILVDAVLIQFQDKIIYDTFLVSDNVYFGAGIRETFRNDYNQSKQAYGIITSLHK